MRYVKKDKTLKGTETRADIWEQAISGGAGGGARRTSKKAKKKSPEISRSEKETGVSHAEAERLFGDWLKKGGKPRKNMLEQVDKASRKNMKKMMKSPDYGKKFTFSKKLKKMVGLE